jgi:hypothetical protein
MGLAGSDALLLLLLLLLLVVVVVVVAVMVATDGRDGVMNDAQQRLVLQRKSLRQPVAFGLWGCSSSPECLQPCVRTSLLRAPRARGSVRSVEHLLLCMQSLRR